MPTINSSSYTTLYSATAQEIVPATPYGNSNVEAFLNQGTDGGNTVQNILANGEIVANGNITTNDFFVGDGGYLSNITAYSNVIANVANFANFAGNVTNSAQPNITSVGTLINLTVSGNSNLANINVSGGIKFSNNNVSPDILVSNNASNTTTRQLSLQAGNLDYTGVASNQTAGSLRLNSGNSDGSGSATTWIARGGSQILAAGFATSNIGNALSGAYNILAGDATSLLTGNSTTGAFLVYGGAATANVGAARNGNMEFLGGGAYTETGNSQGGNIVITAGSATSNTSGNAIAGSITIDTQLASGVTSSTQGNINIGTGGAAQAINIGHGSATIYANAGIEVAPNVGIHTVFDGGGTYPEHIMWRSNTYIGGGPEGTAQWQPVTSRGSLASPANIGGGDTILKFETAVNTGTTTPYGPYTGYSYGPAIRAINTFNPGVDPDPIGYAYSYGNIQFTTAGNLNSNDYVLRTDLGPNGVSVYGFVPTNGFAAADTKFDINLSNGSSYSPTVTAGSFDGNGNLTVANTVISENLNVGNSSNTTLQFYTNKTVMPGTGFNVSLLTTGGYNGLNWSFDEATLIEGWDSSIDTAGIDHGWYGNDTVSGNVVYAGSMTTTMYGPVGSALSPSFFNVAVYEPGSDLSNVNTGTFTGFQVGQGGFTAVVGSQTNNPAIGAFIYGNTTQSQATAIRINRRRGNSDARTNVVANDYLGNIEWRGSGSATGSLNSKIVTFGAKVDSSYGGPGNVMPIGFEMDVVNSSNAFIAHNFYANGDVSFSGGNSVIYSNGNAEFNNLASDNVSINTNGFMKLASYTAAGLNAITGQIGWMAAVSDSAGGGNPNGMIAFWDTTNARWSYVHDNSAV